MKERTDWSGRYIKRYLSISWLTSLLFFITSKSSASRFYHLTKMLCQKPTPSQHDADKSFPEKSIFNKKFENLKPISDPFRTVGYSAGGCVSLPDNHTIQVFIQDSYTQILINHLFLFRFGGFSVTLYTPHNPTTA